MASSRVMTSSSSGNSDLALKSALYPSPEAAVLPNSASSGDPPKSLGSMSMEDLLRNICGDSSPLVAASPFAGSGEPGSVEAPAGAVKSAGIKTAEEVWREITAGRRSDVAGGAVAVGSGSEGKDAGEMTLEDFLTRAGAVMEEDVRVPSGGFSADSAAVDRLGQPLTIENPVMGFGNGMELVVGGGGRGGRSRRRQLLDPEDKAALQRQKRMIKNRESAARSRERKQAYTTELESLVHQLEQENAQLHYQWDQKNKKKLKQLMEMVFPVKVMPPRKLRRTSSMNW